MRKIISILLALGVILGLTVMAAPVAAQPCTCPTTMSTFDILTPPFCAGVSSNYLLGSVTPITVPVTLLPGTDKFSVDFPADTSLASVLAAGVSVSGVAPGILFPAASPAAITVSGQHLEFVIPAAWLATNPVVPAGQTITITVNSVINPTVDGTYCLYVDYKQPCCAAVQFACKTYVVSPATKEIGFHFDFSNDYAGLAEDYIPAFKACGDSVHGTLRAPGYATTFDLIVRDENGGCNNPCTSPPSMFWWEVTKCPAGEQIWIDDGTAGAPYTVDATDIGVTKFDLLTLWLGWPPVDRLYTMEIHFSSPGDYELKFFIQCPAVGCPSCGGPTIIATGVLPAKVYQYLDAWEIPLEQKWNLISLPLFPYDTSIASVLGSMDRIDQLKSVWYFGQCDGAGADVGVWSTSAYAAGVFTGPLTNLVAGKAYWIRTLHSGETGYLAGTNSFWVFGTSSIMPDPTGVDMGYFDVCEGWNMVGFKAPWVAGVAQNEWDDLYLWNFNPTLGGVHYGLIYQWVPGLPGSWTTYQPTFLNMQPGEGYWIPFDGDGEIYPSA